MLHRTDIAFLDNVHILDVADNAVAFVVHDHEYDIDALLQNDGGASKTRLALQEDREPARGLAIGAAARSNQAVPVSSPLVPRAPALGFLKRLAVGFFSTGSGVFQYARIKRASDTGHKAGLMPGVRLV